MSAASQASGFYQISASVDNVKQIFVHLQRAKANNKAENPYLFDTYKLNATDNNSYLTTCRSNMVMEYFTHRLSMIQSQK